MFKQYPDILYPFKFDGKEHLLKDITTNVKLQVELVNKVAFFEYYDVLDGETPEIVAHKYYGNPNWHYLILLANEIWDWREFFPKDRLVFENYVKDSYVNPNGIHHYENLQGEIIPWHDGEEIIPITNYQYEYALNESKRRIKVINKSIANAVVKAIEDELE